MASTPLLPRPLDSETENGAPLRILVADDHARLRGVLIDVLRHEPDFEVVGEAQDGQAAVEQVEQWLPDVMTVDIRMPRLSGIEVTRQVHAAHPQVAVLGLTDQDDAYLVRALLQAGACGYVLKRSGGHQLISAIRQIQAGQTALDPAVTEALNGAGMHELQQMAEHHLAAWRSVAAEASPQHRNPERDTT